MIWLNGDIVSAEAAISANDRGLLLGESVFETVLVKNQVPQFWTAHLARLAASCTALGLSNPHNAAALRDGVMALFEADKARHGEKPSRCFAPYGKRGQWWARPCAKGRSKTHGDDATQ